jgi:hypothetical protein
MPGFSLPTVGSNSDMKALANAFMMLVKELKFLLQNLDNDNISELDASKIKNLDLDTLFADLIVANTIITETLYADYIQSNTAVTNILYAQEGRIARLTVDHLLTGDFISGSEYIYFIDAQDQYLKFIIGHRNDALPQVHYTDEDDQPLYWDSATHNYMTPTETEYPVMVYVYDLTTKLEMNFEHDSGGTPVPAIVLGAGAGVVGHPEYGKGYIFKDTEGLLLKYITSAGKELTAYLNEDGIEIKNTTSADEESTIQMTDFVDAKMRRAEEVTIDKTAGTLTVLMEGDSTPEVINFTETTDSITYSWPDGFTTTVQIS